MKCRFFPHSFLSKQNIFHFSDKTPKGQAPSFLKKIGDIEVYEGMKARFTACASGYPEPEVEWFINGDRIYPNERTLIESEPNGKTLK